MVIMLDMIRTFFNKIWIVTGWNEINERINTATEINRIGKSKLSIKTKLSIMEGGGCSSNDDDVR